MVQDKDKLKEVGLEPDKPVGHIRAIWALTLILAFAIVIVGGVYFILWYSPWGENALWHRAGKTTDTSDWQTYTDSNYIVSFKYPKNWENKSFASSIKGVVFFDESEKDDVDKAQWTSLTQYPGDIAYYVDPNASLEQTLAKFKSENSNCEVTDKKIGDKDGKALLCPSATENKTTWYYLVGKTTTTFYLFTNKDEQKDTLDKMVGTFKFGGATASPSATASANYSTYTEKTNGSFSFEYPKDLKITKKQPFDEPTMVFEIWRDKNGVLVSTGIEISSIQGYPNPFNSSMTTAQAYSQKIGKTIEEQNGSSNVQTKTIDGKSGYVVNRSGIPGEYWVFDGNKYLYSVTVSPIGEADPDESNILGHIISSWKFL